MLKLSDDKGFWYKLQLSYRKVYREAIKIEQSMKKIKHFECKLKFSFDWCIPEICLLKKMKNILQTDSSGSNRWGN